MIDFLPHFLNKGRFLENQPAEGQLHFPVVKKLLPEAFHKPDIRLEVFYMRQAFPFPIAQEFRPQVRNRVFGRCF